MGLQCVEGRVPRVQPMEWHRPSGGRVKLSVDGCYLGNLRRSGSGVLRNDTGHFMVAYSTFYGEGTNTRAKVQFLLDGLKSYV